MHLKHHQPICFFTLFFLLSTIGWGSSKCFKVSQRTFSLFKPSYKSPLFVHIDQGIWPCQQESLSKKWFSTKPNHFRKFALPVGVASIAFSGVIVYGYWGQIKDWWSKNWPPKAPPPIVPPFPPSQSEKAPQIDPHYQRFVYLTSPIYVTDEKAKEQPEKIDLKIRTYCEDIRKCPERKEAMHEAYQAFVDETLLFLFKHRDLLIDACAKDIEDKIEKGFFHGYYPELCSYTYQGRVALLLEKLLGDIPFEEKSQAWQAWDEALVKVFERFYPLFFSKEGISKDEMKKLEKSLLKELVEVDQQYAFNEDFYFYLKKNSSKRLPAYLDNCSSFDDLYILIKKERKCFK